MNTPRAPFVSALALLLVGAAHSFAGVLVVDGANGLGTDFTGLQTAIDAAASGDVLLVRSGDYGGITIDGKGLTIVADTGATVNCGPDFLSRSEVKNVTAGQTVALRGLHFDVIWPINGMQVFVGTTLAIHDCSGSVWVEDCSVVTGGPSLGLDACADVTLAGCQLTGYPRTGDACRSRGSIASLVHCLLVGGKGPDAGPTPFFGFSPAGKGGRGLTVPAANTPGEVTLMACTLRGGHGGDGAMDIVNCAGPANGGDALSVGEFSGVTPVVRHVDCTLIGGAPGATVPCAAPASPGAAITVSSGTELQVPGQTPLLSATTPTREGQQVALAIDGQAGSSALLLLSALPGGAFVYARHGDLLLGGSVLVLPLAALPPGGHLPLSLTVPHLGAGLEGVTLYLQAATCASGDCTLGTGSALVLLDASI